jgi:hypothetical protein
MATDTHLIQGEIAEDPSANDMDVERLLIGFLRALVEEQGPGAGTCQIPLK